MEVGWMDEEGLVFSLFVSCDEVWVSAASGTSIGSEEGRAARRGGDSGGGTGCGGGMFGMGKSSCAIWGKS
jgi:hypothetical protein